MQVQGRQRAGVGEALGAAALFGLSTPLAKLLLAEVSPQVLAGLLYLGSGIGLALFWLFRRARVTPSPEARLTWRDLPWLAGAVAAGGVVAPVLLLAGLAATPASTASLLLNLEGVFTALIAWIVFRENVDRRIFLGMGAIVAGGVLLSWAGGVTLGGIQGPLLVVAACLGWALDNNLTQKVSASDPVEIAGLKGLAAGAVNLCLGLTFHGALPEVSRLVGALLVGFMGYGVSLVFFVLAMRHLGTARTGAYFSLAPFVGAAAGLVLFREPVTPPLLLGALLMGLGLWLHLTERHEHDHVHQPLRHAHQHLHDEHHQHSHGSGDPPSEPHAHVHLHPRLVHRHPHYPDIHHRHTHG
ncbi:MAG: EamA family transporter [Gemmatimonadales bacterium]|nr:EamA family transporter [Gemmatimonadales bacterium]